MTRAWDIFKTLSAVIVLLELAIAILFIISSLILGSNPDRRRAMRRKQ